MHADETRGASSVLLVVVSVLSLSSLSLSLFLSPGVFSLSLCLTALSRYGRTLISRNQDHADCGRDTVRSPGFPSHSRRTETTDDEPARREPVASLSPSRHLSRCAGKASVMMDLIMLFSELVATFIILVTRPFSLFKLACFFTMKTVFIVIHTWMGLVRATFGFHVNLFSRIIMLTVTLISLPARILNALKRERQLELYLHDIQIELENLEWDRKELGDNLQIAIKERKMLELILAEVEEEHDKAIAKIEQLEDEFQDLKNENLRLKEIKDEGYWSIKGPDDMGNGQNTGISESSGIPYGISSWKSSYNGSGIFLQDPMMSKDTWGVEGKSKTKFLNFLTARIQPLNPEIISRQLDVDEVLGQRREVAMSQSLFSAVLSLLVGMIIWEAEDPCMPLVVALFTVVGMSLKSVVELFSTIKIKPASDAVALLSFNWFVLGMLTYPALPRVARMLAPMSLRVVDKLVSSL